MRYLFLSLILASPALAHPANLPHAHSADWVVPVAMLGIGVAIIATKRRAIWKRK